jgi:uncharacterized protein (TIGR02145 family)
MKRNEIVVLTFAGIVLIFASLILIFGFSFIGCDNTSSRSNEKRFSELFEKKGDHIIKNAVTDMDGNTYNAVKLGEQVWMAENLRTTGDCRRLYDGVVQQAEPVFISPSIDPECPDYFYVEGVSSIGKEIYYSHWPLSELCPKGWHVPSLDDWKQLENYLKTKPEYIAGNCEANVAKSLASNEGWDFYANPSPDDYGKIACNPMTTNNATGFSAKPVGYIHVRNQPKNEEIGIDLFGVGRDATFWTSSITSKTRWIVSLDCETSTILFFDTYTYTAPDKFDIYHDDYYSVRCIKD